VFSEYELQEMSKERLISVIKAAIGLYEHRIPMAPLAGLAAHKSHWEALGIKLVELREGDKNE